MQRMETIRKRAFVRKIRESRGRLNDRKPPRPNASMHHNLSTGRRQ